MILQALKDYYDRKAADPESGIAPLGWEWKEIPFVFVIAENGKFLQIEDTREVVGKKKRAKPFRVPQSVVRTRNPAAFTLWDKAEYAFPGIAKGTDADKKHALFLDCLDKYSGELPSVLSVRRFLTEHFDERELRGNDIWNEYVQSGAVATFKIAGHELPVPCENEFFRIYNEHLLSASEPPDGICLVTGHRDVVSRTHHKIVGVIGTDKGRGSIVSFNWDAAESFGKEQGYNSPIGKKAEFAYTTALNTLLASSRQKMSVGDATMVFWSERNTVLEDEFADLFREPDKDDPDRGIVAVERLLASVKTGSFSRENEETRFYVLGLAPNVTRIAVRFWHVGTVAEMERRFADWFENLQIVHGPKDKEHLSLTRLLLSTAPYNKDFQKWKANISPNLAGAVMRSILEGTQYPAILLSSAILRIKAEHEVTYPRAKIIKAFINHNLNQERRLTVSLDKGNANVGYRLGRLFAVLEQIQLAANDYKSPNATIRDKFYAAASSTPAVVFGNLMRLKNYHLAKLSKTGFYEGLIGEILYRDSEHPGVQSFPTHLSLQDQGMFAIGYYHQRQDFFAGKQTKKDDDSAKNTKSAPEGAEQQELSF